MNRLNMLLESSVGGILNAWPYIRAVLLIIMAVCALFIILVVMFQPGNSSGISALGGQSETFLSKNRGKTFEYKMKVLTVISGIVFAVLCILVAVLSAYFKSLA